MVLILKKMMIGDCILMNKINIECIVLNHCSLLETKFETIEME